ncbi:MAG: 2-oxo acid dehydrogenase subunit E2 [Acidimicrobiia bacterium]|nr:2-oxo acid dehydrogenase subunit E2 [Acidimicrobiia bacterium]
MEGFDLGYLPFVVRAWCDVSRDYPHVNASVVDDSLVVHRELNLAVAIDLDDDGTVAPVLHGVDGMRLRLVAVALDDVAERARSGALGPDEVEGATFTVTDMSGSGAMLTLPVIEQPQVAVLSLGAVVKSPVVVAGPGGEDAIAVHHVGHLALAWDHRAFDGATRRRSSAPSGM